MEENKDFERLRYFLDCYFNLSADYSDLLHLANEYRESEREMNVIRFRKELEIIREERSWAFARDLIREHGGRNLTVDRVIKMVDLLLEGLHDPTSG